MSKNQHIKKVLAAVLMLIFAISITPTIVFHDLFASHTDSVSHDTDQSDDVLSTAVFNCHCDHLVAVSPFTGTNNLVISVPLPVFPELYVINNIQFKSCPDFFHSLRGPPAV